MNKENGIRRRLPWIIAVALVGVALAPVLLNQFVWDDRFLVEIYAQDRYPVPFYRVIVSTLFENSSYVIGDEVLFWRPLTSLIIAGAGLAFGGWSPGYHLVSLMAALFAAYGLGYLLLRIIPSELKAIALILPLLFLAHPLTAEVLSMVANLADHLVIGFFLLQVAFYTDALRSKDNCPARLYWLAGLLALGACLSKELGVICILSPALAIVLVWAADESKPSFGNFKMWMSSIIPVALFIVARSTIVDATSLNLFSSFKGAISTICLGLGQALQSFIIPNPRGARLYIDIEAPMAIVAGCIFVIALMASIVYCFVKAKRPTFTAIGFCLMALFTLPSLLTLSPDANGQLVFPTRYFMAPGIGLMLILIGPFKLFWGASARALSISVLAIGCLSLISFTRITQWRDSLSFWTAEVEYHRDSPDELLHLGWHQLRLFQYKDAEKTINELARHQMPDKESGAQLLGMKAKLEANHHRNFNKAISLLDQAIKLTPNDLNLTLGLAEINWLAGNKKETIDILEKAKASDLFQKTKHQMAIEKLKLRLLDK